MANKHFWRNTRCMIPDFQMSAWKCKNHDLTHFWHVLEGQKGKSAWCRNSYSLLRLSCAWLNQDNGFWMVQCGDFAKIKQSNGAQKLLLMGGKSGGIRLVFLTTLKHPGDCFKLSNMKPDFLRCEIGWLIAELPMTARSWETFFYITVDDSLGAFETKHE